MTNSFQSTYRAGNTNIGLPAELLRLEAQALMGWKKEFRNMQLFGLKDGMNLLEVGCGPGFFTEKVAANLPNSFITGLDIDEALLDQAEQRLHRDFKERVGFVQASVMDTNLPDDTYDFVVARMIFLHLHEPEEAVLELQRVLKPGGKIVIIDIDDGIFGATDPDIEGFHTIRQKFIKMQESAGGNRLIGRSLPRLLKSAGFVEVDLETVAVHSDLVGIEGFKTQFDPKRFEGFYQSGVLSKNEFSSMKRYAEKLGEDPDTYAMIIFVMACGEKI